MACPHSRQHLSHVVDGELVGQPLQALALTQFKGDPGDRKSIQVHVVRFKSVLSAILDRVDRAQMGMDLLQAAFPRPNLPHRRRQGSHEETEQPLPSGQLEVISLVVLPREALSPLCRDCLLSRPKKLNNHLLRIHGLAFRCKVSDPNHMIG